MSLVSPLGGPGDGTGLWADIIKRARVNGIFYTTSAGNNAEHSWSGTFTDIGDGSHQWVPGVMTNVNYFGPGDGVNAYIIPAGFLIQVALHWDDWTAVNQNYDLLLFYWNGSSWVLVAVSDNLQNGKAGQMPLEEISVSAPNTGFYGVLVFKKSATRNVCFRLNASHGGPRLDKIVAERSIMFPGDSPDAITVGAVDVSPPYPLEAYSSHGPTFGPGGACTGGSTKPDIAAYARVSTVTWGMFGGTSAATPHVAGAAALILSVQSNLNPDEVQSIIQSSAVDMGSGGKDNLYGWGRLQISDVLPLKGDIDGSGTVDLVDATIAIKVLVGSATSDLVRSDYATSGADVNGDNKVGVEELIYIMQEVSGVR
jgi:subtilisin family serine protease